LKEKIMIDGVTVRGLKIIPDERGRLMEILRSDWPEFKQFGQVYLTTAYPGVVKAWHYHKKQTDTLCVVKGTAKVALYDAREDSPTKGEVAELFMGELNPMLVTVPALVYHGFKCVSQGEAMVINVPTALYVYDDPDEFRIDPYDNDIPYDWGRRVG
jgi:dTDP-4-dehydrorhamnose 3,5-epimerase